MKNSGLDKIMCSVQGPLPYLGVRYDYGLIGRTLIAIEKIPEDPVSNQSGGSGYNKVKKSCQSGGASGWAKHCGSTDDHKKSNRTERRRAKDRVTEDDGVSRLKPKGKKIPTRRHLMDKYTHLKAEWDKRKKDVDEHRAKVSKDCKCWMYCRDFDGSDGDYFMKWRKRQLEKILKEFEKYGYKKPA